MVLEPGTSRREGGEVATGEKAVRASQASHSYEAARRMRRVRWLLWSVLALCYLIVYFHRIAPGVVADRLMADFAASGAAVGVLTSIYFYMYAVMQIPAGALADTLGVRRTVAAAAALSGLGSLVFALSPSLEIAYFGRFLVGLGVSVVFVAALKFQANWFRASEFGTVSGMMMVAGNLGGVTATTPVALMSQALGWRLSFVVIGVVGCAMSAVAWRWVRDRPSELGLPPHREIGATGRVDGTIGRAPATKEPFLAGARTVWRNRQTWAGFVAHFGLLGANLTFTGLWAVPYLMHVSGMDRPEAANHLLVTSLGLLVSAPLAGHVSDRLLRRRRLPILALGTLACAFWLTMAFWNGGKPPVWALYPLFALQGLSSGNVALVLTAVKEANPPRLAGLAIGTSNSAFLCAALLQPAMGYLLDSRWQGAVLDGARVYPVETYQVVLGILAGFALAGLVGAWFIKETHCRNVAEG